VLSAFLREVAEETAQQVSLEEPQSYITVTGVDLLFTVSAYALFRWAKDAFDHRRALNEAEIARQQEQLIAALIQDGFPPDKAQAVVTTLLKNIAVRTQDDPAIKKALSLLGKS